MSSFRKEEALEQHLKLCKNHEAGIPKMPIKGKNDIFKFQNYNMKMRMPFVMYGDFECFLKPIQSCKPNNEKRSLINSKYIFHQVMDYIRNVLMMKLIAPK